MNNIKTYQDLLNVKRELVSELANRRHQIRIDVVQLKEDWKPIAGLLSGVGKISMQSKIHPILSLGINLLGHAIIKNILPLRSGWVARAMLPALTNGLSNLLDNKDGTSGFRKLLDRFKKHQSNGSDNNLEDFEMRA